MGGSGIMDVLNSNTPSRITFPIDPDFDFDSDFDFDPDSDFREGRAKMRNACDYQRLMPDGKRIDMTMGIAGPRGGGRPRAGAGSFAARGQHFN